MKFLLAPCFLLLASLFLTACCPCAKPPILNLTNLPAPISVEEQIRLLNTRAQAIPLLISHIDKLEILALDEKGKEHPETADSGILEIRQYLDRNDASADIYLEGRLVLQTILELGKNDRNFWYAIYGNYKEAHIGDISNAPNFSGAAKDIYRADLHLQMLALGPILPAPNRIIALQVDDLTAKNHLFIERITSTGLAQMDRQLIIDRRTGQIDEVDLYDSSGSLLARSLLSDYVPVEYVGGAASSQNPPTIPTTINIQFPTLKATVTLKLANPKIPPSIPDKVFQPSDFQSEGLKVIPIQ